MKYKVKKISVNSWNPDGSHCYDYQLNYPTWRELTADMDYREKYENVIFHGCGAHIFMGHKKIGNVTDFWDCEISIKNIGVRQFINVVESHN